MPAGIRIVSLVPSLTELLCDLGLREQLVGRTGFCIHPREALRDVPKVGGTKDVRIERVRALAPTHLVVNVDENDREAVEQLAGFVPNVVVTHPLNVDDNLALLESFGETFGVHEAAGAIAERMRAAREAVRARRFAALPVTYLIWKDPWMSIGRDTFIASMLAEAGLVSTIAASEPRYPVLPLEAIAGAGARAVLLSSEPYRFVPAHSAALHEALIRVGAGPAPLCTTIDGEMASWYGSRPVEGLRYLLGFRENLERALDAAAAGGGQR